jgi:hypothetical protein
MTASVDHTRTSRFDVRLDLRRREAVVGEDVARNHLVLGHRDLIPDPIVSPQRAVAMFEGHGVERVSAIPLH